MAREDGFLSRWSRLKQEASRPGPPQPSQAKRDAERAVAVQHAAQEAEAEAARLAAETREREALLARLPRLEDLRSDSDFSQFMHPLIPPSLRSAALARLWTLDAAIRGYEDPARDYAWNWNVPGGVPGGGPAPTADEVQSTLKQIFQRFESEERVGDLPSAKTEADVPAPASSDAGSRPQGGPEQVPVAPRPENAERRDDAAPHHVAPAVTDAPDGVMRVPDATSEPVAAPVPPAAPRRRHGGAMPV
jgi:hypothetical protein